MAQVDSAPGFSVIIPTYNRRELLRQALASVWAQTFSDYEVIVVDDGSTDGTWEELQVLRTRIRALRQENNAGPGAARNSGGRYAAGKYLAFLDSDDLWFPWTLAVYQQVIRQTGDPAFVAGKPLRFQDNSFLLPAREAAIGFVKFRDYFASGDEWRWWGASSFVVRRDSFNGVGGFTDEWVNCEDADLALRLGTAPGFAQITMPVTFAYREHLVSAMRNLPRTVAGCRVMIQAEHTGAYQGGRARVRERLRILSRHLRPVSLDCLREGLRAEAFQIYWSTFRWNLILWRWKYLLGFLIRAMFSRRSVRAAQAESLAARE